VRTLLTLLIVALVIPWAAPDAAAQGFVPPRKKAKRKPRKTPVPVPVPVPVPEPVAVPEPAPVTAPETETETGTETETETETEPDPGTGSGTGSGTEDTVRIVDDDLPPVGADVTISDSEAAAARTAAGGGDSARKLETLAMTYARMSFDLVRDPAPEASMGLDPPAEDILTFRLHGRAEGTGRFGRRAKIKVAGRVDAEVGFNLGDTIGVERYEAAVWDTYADIYGSWLDVRAGNQIVAWGVCDLLTPNDVVNARDLRRGPLAPLDEIRLPVLALKAKAYSGPLWLEGLWVPVAPANRFDLVVGDFALLGRNAPTRNERTVGAIVNGLRDDPMLGLAIRPILDIGEQPDNGVRTGELGARAGISTRRLDLSALVLWGHDRNPRITVAPELIAVIRDTPSDMLGPMQIAGAIGQLAMMGKSAVRTDYPRQLHTGGGIATRIEPVGLKLEGGYQPFASTILVPSGAGPLVGTTRDLPQLAVTASIDYDRGDRFSAILEGSFLKVLNVPAGQTVFQMDGDQLFLVATRVEWRAARLPVSVRLTGFVDLSSPSYAVGPALAYQGSDRVSVELSAALFGGPAGTLGGLADHNDEVAMTVRYGL